MRKVLGRYVVCCRDEYGIRRVLHDEGGKDRPELWGAWPEGYARQPPPGAKFFATKPTAQRVARRSSESNFVIEVR